MFNLRISSRLPRLPPELRARFRRRQLPRRDNSLPRCLRRNPRIKLKHSNQLVFVATAARFQPALSRLKRRLRPGLAAPQGWDYCTGGFGSDAAAICAMSSSAGGVGDRLASASRNIVLQKGQAAPTTEAPVLTSCSARSTLTRLPFSSPRKASPPPAPQQNERSCDR